VRNGVAGAYALDDSNTFACRADTRCALELSLLDLRGIASSVGLPFLSQYSEAISSAWANAARQVLEGVESQRAGAVVLVTVPGS
jgi:hypothetical protein